MKKVKKKKAKKKATRKKKVAKGKPLQQVYTTRTAESSRKSESGERKLVESNNNNVETADLLSAELGECIEFPIEAMPNVLRPLIAQGAKSIQCPPDYIAIPLLVCLGVAIGRTRVLKVKSGWQESTSLWVVILGKPGAAKTPAFDLATKPLQEIQQKFSRQVGKLSRGRKRIIVSDTTVEALTTIMSKNPRGIILIRDELAGWINSMNQYKGNKGADEQFYLATWSGQPCCIDRKNLDEPIYIPNTYLAIAGCVQPKILERLLNKERHEEGFASRLLICYPPEVERKWTDEGIEDRLIEPVNKLFEKLINLKLHNDKPIVVRFSPSGYQAFRKVMKDHLKQTKRYGLDNSLAAHWAKLEGYTARLCLIIHLVRYYSGETARTDVDRVSVYMAATLIDYFKAHIARFYKRIDRRQTVSDRILNWAKRHIKNNVSVRDIISARIAENRDEAVKVLDDMENEGYGHWHNPDKKRKFVITYSQQSATQQNRRETGQNQNQSKWLMKLRRLQ